jgi:hypothetical protein
LRIADTRQFHALDSYPRISSDVTTGFYDALSSELEPVYKGRLARFTRRIVFLKPRYIFSCDEMASRDASARFDWLLHVADKARLSRDSGAALYAGGKASLGIRVLAPREAHIRIRGGHLPFSAFNPAAPKTPPAEPGIFDVNANAADGQMHFLIALAPECTAEAARAAAASFRYLKGDGCSGVQAGDDLVLFRSGAGPAPMRCSGVAADAGVCTISGRGAPVLLAAEEARRIERSGRVLMTSDAAVDFAAQFEPDHVDVRLSAVNPARIRLYVKERPRRVQIDGNSATAPYDPATGMVEISAAAGDHSSVPGCAT